MATSSSPVRHGRVWPWLPVTAQSSTGIVLAAIWLAVVLASIFSPDMITGSEHEHLPIAGITTWFWGSMATAFVLMAAGLRRGSEESAPWSGFAVAVISVWAAVTLASIFGPEMVTGSDPTQIPIAAIIAPPIALVVTAFASLYLAGAERR